jgi:hypothetical protein
MQNRIGNELALLGCRWESLGRQPLRTNPVLLAMLGEEKWKFVPVDAEFQVE